MFADPGVLTLVLSKLQVAPVSEVDSAQERATVPENPSLGVTFSAMVALPPVFMVAYRETGNKRKCGFGVPLIALISAVTSTDPHPVTRS